MVPGMTSWQMAKMSSRKPGKIRLGAMQTFAVLVEFGVRWIGTYLRSTKTEYIKIQKPIKPTIEIDRRM